MSLKDFATKIKQLDKVNVKSGWFKDSRYPDGTPVAYVATIHEYGVVAGGVHIPPRPFMRPAEADHKKQWGRFLAKQSADYLTHDRDIESEFAPVGQMIQQDIEDKIINGSHAPLSPITLLLRKWRDDGKKITKSTVEEARRYLEKNPNATLSKNIDPLRDTGLMLATLSYKVEK